MKKNRQSVIVDDHKFNSNSKIKDKGKSRIFDVPIQEEDFNKSNISKKNRKTFMKDISGFPNEASSQRTDKNLLLKQNKNKSKEKLDLSENKKEKEKSKKDLNRLETMGLNMEEEKKNGENSISSWEEDSGEEVNSEDQKKEVNKKWYKPYYLTNQFFIYKSIKKSSKRSS